MYLNHAPSIFNQSFDRPKLTDPYKIPRYSVNAADKQPLLNFIVQSLEACNCKVLFSSGPKTAPFQIVFERQNGERIGIVAYAFLANRKETNNRPSDERRFQVKYGSKDGGLHAIWQDPNALYITLFLGIDPKDGYFVGADPTLHNPTKFFISIEFKDAHVKSILNHGWFAWERDRRADSGERAEVLVGGTKDSFLRYVLFEREAKEEDQGHRQLLAEKDPVEIGLFGSPIESDVLPPPPSRIHKLAAEFQLSESEVLNVIATAPRLKMAVRGWVAEEHLRRTLITIQGISECKKIEEEGGPDIWLKYKGIGLTVECKNVLRNTNSKGTPRLDFQRTRASKSDPCSRYYKPTDFNLVAACLHSITEKWEFMYTLPEKFPEKQGCPGRLANNILVDELWSNSPNQVLDLAILKV